METIYKAFYSHALRGARPLKHRLPTIWTRFLLTRPSRGATPSPCRNMQHDIFLLTRPSRGATAMLDDIQQVDKISTHTPLAGRDLRQVVQQTVILYFYSHAPRGARQLYSFQSGSWWNFYSHAPRGARQHRPDCPGG